MEIALTFYQVAPLIVQALVSASAAAAVAESAELAAGADPYPPIKFVTNVSNISSRGRHRYISKIIQESMDSR